MTNEISLPMKKLAEIGKQFPALNRSVNSMLQGKGKDLPSWPEYIFLPMAAWVAVVTGGGAAVRDERILGRIAKGTDD